MMMVGVIALIVFGPHRLPEIARSIGKTIAEFKRQASDVREEFRSGLEQDEPEDEKPADEKPAHAQPADDRSADDQQA